MKRAALRGALSARLWHAAGLAILLGLAVIAVRELDLREIVRAIASADVKLLAVATAANVLSLGMQAGRWFAVVQPVLPRARTRDAFFALVAGYAIGIVVPARASDLARAHLMSRRSGGSTTTLTTTAVVDHLVGSLALFAMLGPIAAVWPVPEWVRSAGTLASGFALAGLVALWLLRPRRGSRDPANAMPDAVPDAVPGTGLAALGGFLSLLRNGLVAVGSPRAIGTALVFAVAAWMCEGLIAHLALRAFALPRGIAPSMLVVVGTTVSAAASVSPGNAGAFEVACIAALAVFDVGREEALAFAIGYHAAHLIPTALIGGAWLVGHGYRPATLRGLT